MTKPFVGSIIPFGIKRKGKKKMEKTGNALSKLSKEIIRYKGAYAKWAKNKSVSYNELLVMYTITEEGSCTQKKICDDFLLPRQTMHNVFSAMKNNGYIEVDKSLSKGREKAFVLTAKGKEYAYPVLNAVSALEEKAKDGLGEDKIWLLVELLEEFNDGLSKAMSEESDIR